MRLKSLLKRLVDKIVKDALPAGLASILGGLLLTHFQIDRVPQPTTVKVTQASPEMMQLLRDEHGMIIDFVKEQVASEKSRGSADQSGQRGVTEASASPAVQVVAPPPTQRPIPVVGASSPPAPAQTQPADPVPQAARTDDSLLAKTIGIKDQVVSVTQRAVSATIGVIPSWFGSLGDRIGGEGQSPRPPANLVSASWIVPSAADR
jgi:hypothetical protein